MIPVRRHARLCLACLAAGGLAVTALLVQSSKKYGSYTESNSEKAQDATLEAIAGALHRAEKRYLSKHKHQETPNGFTNKIKTAFGNLATSEWLMIGFTGIIAGAAIVSFIVARGQQTVMQRQLDEMAIEQRPWVYSEIPSIQEGITINQLGWFLLNVKLKLHNVGHLPARYTYVIAVSTVVTDLSGISAKVKDVCEKGVGPNFAGITLFPGEDFTYTSSVGINPREIVKAFSSGPVPWYVIYGCVIYQFPNGDAQYNSGFAYLVEQAKGGDATIAHTLPISPDVVPKDELLLVPWISLGSFNAN